MVLARPGHQGWTFVRGGRTSLARAGYSAAGQSYNNLHFSEFTRSYLGLFYESGLFDTEMCSKVLVLQNWVGGDVMRVYH